MAEANQTIGDRLAARREGVETTSPRAFRLWELENDQPPWLTAHIGRLPRASRKLAGQTETRRAWRRAAIAPDDYRTAVGPDDLDAALSASPLNPVLRRHYETAQRALEQLAQLRERTSRRGLCD